jgi:hypothetical protein
VAGDPAPGCKVECRQIRKTRLRGWGEDRGAERQAHRLDLEVRVGVPALRSTILQQLGETMDFAHVVEHHARPAAGQPLEPGLDMAPAQARRLASAGEADRVSVFRVAHGTHRARALDAET